uniref:MULE transposase domain-containing protein n=1 Tax=Ditylenchus dipsaci TaxID=166011 RepID=A0A915EA11_9BILA
MEGTENFVKYFERQWMGLAPQLWSFYQLEHRNKCAEGYHSYLKRNCKINRQSESSICKGENKPRRPNPIYLKINESMKKLWEEYEEATKDAMHDESILSHSINFH